MANVKVTIPEQTQRYILRVEGGYYGGKDPRDPNETKYGITYRKFLDAVASGIVPKKPLKDLTTLEAMQIYEVFYWKPTGGAAFGLGCGTAFVDGAINCGNRANARLMQRTAADLGADVTDDGVIGAKTINALNALPEKVVLYSYLSYRAAYYEACIRANAKKRAEGKTKVDLSRNRRGWNNRLVRLAAEVGVVF